MGRQRRSDHYTRKAKAAGMPARSVFKLEEIDRKHHIVRKGMRVVDLGCRPGSWSTYIQRRTGGNCSLLGVDIHPVDSFPGLFRQMSVEDLGPELVQELLGGPPDLVMSDMAPATMGHKQTDHLRQIGLAELALDLARRVLPPGGNFVCKVFDGSDAPAFVDEVRRSFAKVKRIRPKSTRKESREFFVLGLDHQPRDEARQRPS